jgi:hypothetical protein
MSGDGFHVHGPHDHEVEHAAQHGGDSFSSKVALTTAILATVGALFAYMGGATQANASLYKNNAAIKKTEASNQWNYFQAKSSKQNLAEMGVQLTDGARAEGFKGEVERYKKEKGEIKDAAEGLEKESLEWDKRSDEQMHLHHRWAQATTALQIAIALSAIALITRKSWLQKVVYGFSAIGLALGVLALLHV